LPREYNLEEKNVDVPAGTAYLIFTVFIDVPGGTLSTRPEVCQMKREFVDDKHIFDTNNTEEQLKAYEHLLEIVKRDIRNGVTFYYKEETNIVKLAELHRNA
jgi:hypothetical protein